MSGEGPIRVLVVDDSALMRKVISKMISSDPGLTVVDTAYNGADGVAKAKALRPDVITLDMEMPVMDGMTALRRIKAECTDPSPAVLMCSTLTSQGSHESLAALRCGAADVIAKEGDPLHGGIEAMRDELIAKIKAIASAPRRRPGLKIAEPPAMPVRGLPAIPANTRLVVIGSSTGGPPVLEQILTSLPADLPVPVVVAQHMPPMFTKSLAERLDHQCAITVLHGEDGQPLPPGTATIIPGGKHGRVRERGALLRLEVNGEPAAALYKPSVNELFRSGGEAAGPRCVGVMLTGMGDDGSIGAADLKRAGGLVVAQTAETCVVYGMPKAVVERGIAVGAGSPAQIGPWIAGLVPKSPHGALEPSFKGKVA